MRQRCCLGCSCCPLGELFVRYVRPFGGGGGMAQRRTTRLVVTLGPASLRPSVLRSFSPQGVDLLRLNLSHVALGDLDETLRTAHPLASPGLSRHRGGAGTGGPRGHRRRPPGRPARPAGEGEGPRDGTPAVAATRSPFRHV